MPGAAHRVADDEPVGQRAVIVGAVGADREHLGAAAHEQHRLLADMAEQLAAVGQFARRNPQRQIGADRLSLIFSHCVLPSLFLRARMQRRLAALSLTSWTT